MQGNRVIQSSRFLGNPSSSAAFHGDRCEDSETLEVGPEASLKRSKYPPPERVWLRLDTARVLLGLRSSLLSLADACKIQDVSHGWLQEMGIDGDNCVTLANRHERPIASCARPTQPWNQSRECPIRNPGLRIYAVPRAAGKSDFSGLACQLVRPKGGRMMDVLQMTYKRARRQINLSHRLLKSQNSKSLPIIWT